jgi:hypothetical protein
MRTTLRALVRVIVGGLALVADELEFLFSGTRSIRGEFVATVFALKYIPATITPRQLKHSAPRENKEYIHQLYLV